MPSSAAVLVVYAHPYPRRSRSGRALLSAVEKLPGVTVRSLYNRYPDMAIDVEAEQNALAAADVVVWQCPFYWYGVPALLHLWFEKVLAHGFAYGPGGVALSGKPLLWVTTTGTPPDAYTPRGMHQHPFSSFIHSVEQTARFCGMRWEPPLVVHGHHDAPDAELAAHGREYRARIEALVAVVERKAEMLATPTEDSCALERETP